MARLRDDDVVDAAASWAHIDLSPAQREQLLTFAAWLGAEAIRAGGLGPREGDRILKRHVADSLVFAAGWSERPLPGRLVDIGSGMGLPGIPLAIVWPDVEVTLLDSSGRRVDLARRATRILKLSRVEVRQADVWRIADRWPAVVMRAVFPPDRAILAAARLLEAGGQAVLGLRGTDARQLLEAPEVHGRIVDVPLEILDEPASLLIMSGSGI